MKNKKIHNRYFSKILEYNSLKRIVFRYLVVANILNKTSNVLHEFIKWVLIFFSNDETCLQIKLVKIVLHMRNLKNG